MRVYVDVLVSMSMSMSVSGSVGEFKNPLPFIAFHIEKEEEEEKEALYLGSDTGVCGSLSTYMLSKREAAAPLSLSSSHACMRVICPYIRVGEWCGVVLSGVK